MSVGSGHPRLRRVIGEATIAGLCCWLLAVVVGLLANLLRPRQTIRLLEVKHGPSVVTTSIDRLPAPSALDILNSVAVAPVIETLLFLLVYWALHPRREFGPRTVIFILLMGVLSFFLHGMSLMVINRILPFALLAGLFARWAERYSLGHAFAVTALAHSVWNAIGTSFRIVRYWWA